MGNWKDKGGVGRSKERGCFPNVTRGLDVPATNSECTIQIFIADN